MREKIIGRVDEQDLLKRLYDSPKSEFVAVYGRRRVGKTFLIKEFFQDELFFSVSGLSNAGTESQIKNFYTAMLRQGLESSIPPKDWLDVFNLLADLIESSRAKRKVVLLDELPWMDTPKSGFVTALEHFWNDFASGRSDILLLVCGSATSWIINKLINNHGGLHNRLTRHIFLQPFTLKESEEMLARQGFNLSRYEVAVCYMVFGGIPFYLSLLDSRYSLAQNIDKLLFSPKGELALEFENLYASLFRNAEEHISVVRALSRRKSGLDRTEILKACKLKTGNGITTILNNLQNCGFITQYRCIDNGRKRNYYRLSDFFTLFYFYFEEEIRNRKKDFWLKLQTTPKFGAWAGLTYEQLVFSHIDRVKEKLGISGVGTNEFSYRTLEDDGYPGVQIDLVIERDDRTINLCEIKFCEDIYVLDSAEDMRLRTRLSVFKKNYPKRKYAMQLTLITTFGLANGKYAGIVNNQVLLEDLF